MEFITLAIIFCGLFVGWTIGANDAANCLGTSVGAGLIDYKKAVVIVGILAFVGAVMQGQATTATVGKGIIDTSQIPLYAIVAVLLSASIFVTIITLLGLPISSTQAVVGGIAGIGIIFNSDVSWGTVAKIFFLGFVTPVVALICSFFIYSMYGRISKMRSFLFIEKFLGWAVLLSGAFLAYSLGANNLGNAMGLVVGSNSLPIFLASILGGIAIAVGSITLGTRVMKTVGNDITELSAQSAFSAQAGCALAIYLLTLFGIPTSTSFGIVGGVAGVGLVKGVGTLHKGTLKKIALGWVATPVFSAIMAILTYYLLRIWL